MKFKASFLFIMAVLTLAIWSPSTAFKASAADVCARDVKQCSDGSYVSRDPANSCSFKACPVLQETPRVCTQDVKQCSDGSYVGRDSANRCAFKSCPAVTSGKPSINITSPDDDEELKAGDRLTIEWSFENLPSPNRITISLVNTKTGAVKSIRSNVSASRGEYNWTVPSSLSPGSYKIKIECSNRNKGSYANCSDESSDVLTIVPPISASLTTNKSSYVAGDNAILYYLIRNRDLSAVTFNFNSYCQTRLEGPFKSNTNVCAQGSNSITIAPRGFYKWTIPAVIKADTKRGNYEISAQLEGYPHTVSRPKTLRIK